MKILRNLCSIAIALMLSASCSSNKDFVYLQDMVAGGHYPFEPRQESEIHRDDRLSITVSCKQAELALPFNTQNGVLSVSSSGDLVSDGAQALKEKGYRVDMNGDIVFPILGKLHVEGLTVSQLTELIRSQIIEGAYIKDPIVSIEFLNFKYTVLGAVPKNGTFSVSGDRITIIDAIAQAGNLSANARVDKVSVIREVGQERQVFTHDLRSKEIFNSPCFYLQQNDIVYVEPKYQKKDKEDRTMQFLTVALSVITAASSVLWLLRR